MAPWPYEGTGSAIDLSRYTIMATASCAVADIEPIIRSTKRAALRKSTAAIKGGKILAASVVGVDWAGFTAVSGDTRHGLYAPQCRLRFGSERKSDRVRPSKVFRRRGGYRPPERG